MTNFSNWSGKLNYLKYLVIGFIALFIVSCAPTDSTSPAPAVNTSDPVLFDGNNVVNVTYGNDGETTGHVAIGMVNPNFSASNANIANYALTSLQFNGADLSDGDDLSGESVTAGLDDVDGSGAAAYTYAAGATDDEAGRIAVNLLTPTNTSVISLVAAFTNVTNASEVVSYDFDVTINVAPLNISALIPAQTVISVLTPGGGTNLLDAMVAVSQDGEPQTNTLNYSALAGLVGNLSSLTYPASTTSTVTFIRDLAPLISVNGNVASIVNPVATPTDSDFLNFSVLTPGAAGTYAGAISFSLLGQGNFTGSIVANPGTLTVGASTPVPISGTLMYDSPVALQTGYTTERTVSVNASSDFVRGTDGSLSVSYTPQVSGVNMTVDNDGTVTIPTGLTADTYTVTVTPTSGTAGGTATAGTFTVTVSDAAVGISGSIAYADQDLVQGYTSAANVPLTTPANFTAGNGTVTFSATANPAISGLTAANNGTVTIPTGVTAGTYTVTVSVSSSAGGSVSDATFTITIPTPIGGTIGYDDEDLVTGYTGTANVALASTANFTAGTGDVTFTATASPAISGLTAADNGTVTIPNGVASGTYTVSVSVSSTAGGTVSDATFRLRVQDPISGSLGYGNQSLTAGYTSAQTVDLDDSSFTRGNGTISFTVSPTTVGGQTISVANDGTVTIPTGIGVISATTITVTASSTVGTATATGTFTITVAAAATPVSGSFSYTAPAASSVLVGNTTAVTVNPDLSSLNNATGFSIAAVTSGTDLGTGVVTINNSTGVISIANATRIGSAMYRVTASGATSDTVTADITLRSSRVFAASDLPRPTPSMITRIRLSSGVTENLFEIPRQNTFIIDNSSAAFSFPANANFIGYGYNNQAASTTLTYDATNTRLVIGDTSAGAVSYGFAVNPDILLAGSFDFTVRVSRSAASPNPNIGYVVMLSDGQTSGSGGITDFRYTGAAGIPASAVNRTSRINNYAGGNSTITFFATAPGTDIIYIHSVTITAR